MRCFLWGQFTQLRALLIKSVKCCMLQWNIRFECSQALGNDCWSKPNVLPVWANIFSKSETWISHQDSQFQSRSFERANDSAGYKLNPGIMYPLKCSETLNRDVLDICIRMEVGYAVKSFMQGLNRKFNIRHQPEVFEICYIPGALSDLSNLL